VVSEQELDCLYNFYMYINNSIGKASNKGDSPVVLYYKTNYIKLKVKRNKIILFEF